MTQADLERDKAFVKSIAVNLVPAHLLDDAISEGLIALMEARERGQPTGIAVKREVIDFYRRETHSRMRNPPQMVALPAVLADVPAPAAWPAMREGPRRTFCGDKPTDREMQVLQLLSLGLQHKHIALRLGMAQKTVSVHVRNLRKKFHVRNRNSIALLEAARRAGALEPWTHSVLEALADLNQRLRRLETDRV